ncbi:MAG: 4-alpha-glucanotransferase [Clostridiales bacterium]|nr:4-alpha-glucanotransferase [Clostridiales bacterium]
MGKGIGRRAGILLAMSSLKEAYRFVDFLHDAGQNFWQILPIGPVGKTLSPYQSSSAFAGNTIFIDRAAVRKNPERYAPKGRRYEKFIEENASWLDDHALFEAVRASQKGKPLALWPDELRNPDKRALSELRSRFTVETESIRSEQYCFFTQWHELKRYANLKGIGIIGDLPIYVHDNSAEFWLRRSAFDVDRNGRPATSAGVPPDEFSETGQIWNDPVYEWQGSGGKAAFAFWRERLAQAARLYDGVRIDHFRGFADFYAIPVAGSHASGRSRKISGEWRPGPGVSFVDMIRKEYPGLFVIAEDLGDLSDAAKRLVEYSGFPGMKVLQFAFSGSPKNPYLPHNMPENSVCYTGTHDNNTLMGWLRSAPRCELNQAMAYLGLSKKEDLQEALIAAALASRADTAIIPMQDWLGLGADARTNRPGTMGGRNWKWQVPKGALTPRLAARIKAAAKRYSR